MANPRKFSEKIALQKQKEAEGTAEFERIMKEVSVATSKVDESKINSNIIKTHRESRGRSVGGGPIRRPSERKVDTSPYSSGNVAYLSPPSDSYWRRASSDSAIHQSLVMGHDKTSAMRSSGNFSTSNSKFNPNIMNQNQRNVIVEPHRNLSGIDIRQGSTHLLSSQFCPNADSQMSSSIANTGSLPDLTSVHYASSLPIKQQMCNNKEQQDTCNSAYSSSPVASPTMLSPNSVPHRYHSPVHSPAENSAYSPTHSGSQASQTEKESTYQQVPLGQTSHLSFTNLPDLFHGSQKHVPHSNVIHGSHGHLTTIGMNNHSDLNEYRNPQQRPSPGSSPIILNSVQGSSDTALNSPCSPVSDHKTSQTTDTFHSQDAYNLNQSFQNQFSLVDNRKVDSISNMNTAQHNFQNIQYDHSSYGQYAPNLVDNVNSSYNPHNMNQFDLQLTNQYQDVSNIGTEEDISRKNISDLRLMQDKSYTSPRTPTTIPEIVFSDFSTSTDYSREIFETLDLGQLELGQMDVAGLQMLTDPNIITDPMIEDSFRRDLN